jgi:hypothetical protein
VLGEPTAGLMLKVEASVSASAVFAGGYLSTFEVLTGVN